MAMGGKGRRESTALLMNPMYLYFAWWALHMTNTWVSHLHRVALSLSIPLITQLTRPSGTRPATTRPTRVSETHARHSYVHLHQNSYVCIIMRTLASAFLFTFVRSRPSDSEATQSLRVATFICLAAFLLPDNEPYAEFLAAFSNLTDAAMPKTMSTSYGDGERCARAFIFCRQQYNMGNSILVRRVQFLSSPFALYFSFSLFLSLSRSLQTSTRSTSRTPSAPPPSFRSSVCAGCPSSFHLATAASGATTKCSAPPSRRRAPS